MIIIIVHIAIPDLILKLLNNLMFDFFKIWLLGLHVMCWQVTIATILHESYSGIVDCEHKFIKNWSPT